MPRREQSGEWIVEMRNISKSFGSVKANEGIDLAVREGSVHCLIGENGAGKSTVMSILYGLIQPDSGEIRVRGRTVSMKGPQDANALGIGMVHQHFKLVDSFTVAENIVMGREPTRWLRLNRKAAADITRRLSEQYGLAVDPSAKVKDLPVGVRQRVELLKALHRGSDVLVLDEPTAVLTPQESKELFATLRHLTDAGKTIILITHKMEEVERVADRVTVLRRGRIAGSLERADFDEKKLSVMMVGREVAETLEKAPAKLGAIVLEAKKVVAPGAQGALAVRGASLAVRAGEIVTVAGVEGNGQNEFVEAIAGLRPVVSGQVIVNGREVTNESPLNVRKAGLAHVPSDRIATGLSVRQSVAENLLAGKHGRGEFRRGWLLNRAAIRAHGERLIERFDVRGPGPDSPALALSGGNMQKLVIAREMAHDAPLLIASLPTRGIDIGAIEMVHKHLIAARNEGKGILVVSSDLDEVFQLSDRIVVMYNGRFVGEFAPDSVTREELGLYMIGARKQEKPRNAPGGNAV